MERPGPKQGHSRSRTDPGVRSRPGDGDVCDGLFRFLQFCISTTCVVPIGVFEEAQDPWNPSPNQKEASMFPQSQPFPIVKDFKQAILEQPFVSGWDWGSRRTQKVSVFGC